MRKFVFCLSGLFIFLLGACSQNSTTSGTVVVIDTTVSPSDSSGLGSRDTMGNVIPRSMPTVDSSDEKVVQQDTVQRITGKFVELVEGDYLHFELRDAADGKIKSFFLGEEMPQSDWMPFYEHPEYKGRKVEITWRTVDRYLEHAGAVNRIDEVTSVQLLK